MIRSGITVTVLVVAIVVGSLFSQSKRAPTPSTIQLSAARQSQSDYDKAVAALSAEDTATAIVLLEQAVTTDPANTAAKSKLAELKKPSQTPSPSVSSPGGGSGSTSVAPEAPEPSGPDPFLADIELKKLLPTAMAGFWLGSAQIIAPDATLSGGPTATGSSVKNIVWAVHDRGTEKAAQAFIDNVSKGLYSQDAAAVNVRGVTGYFGTDGTRFATIALRRGRYVFEVVLTFSGTPAEVRALAEIAAASFPSTP